MTLLLESENITDTLENIVREFNTYKVQKINFYINNSSQFSKDSIVYIKGFVLYNSITGMEIKISCDCEDLSIYSLKSFIVKLTNRKSITSFSTTIDALTESDERSNIIKIVGLLSNNTKSK